MSTVALCSLCNLDRCLIGLHSEHIGKLTIEKVSSRDHCAFQEAAF